MAYTTEHHGILPGAFTRFFQALFSGLSRIAENSPHMRQLAEIAEMSDADLRKLGLTREDAVRRALAGRIGL